MPKTKDAFALREFNPFGILQRPFFFRDSKPTTQFLLRYLPDSGGGADVTYLKWLSMMVWLDPKKKKLAEYVEQLQVIRRLQKLTAEYTRKLCRHYSRLEPFLTNADTKEKFDRAWQLRQCYALAIESLGKLQKALIKAEFDVDKILDVKRVDDFATRLKERRSELGLTQLDVATALKASLKKYAAYEQARAQPQIPTLIKICKILKTTPSKLLGYPTENDIPF